MPVTAATRHMDGILYCRARPTSNAGYHQQRQTAPEEWRSRCHAFIAHTDSVVRADSAVEGN